MSIMKNDTEKLLIDDHWSYLKSVLTWYHLNKQIINSAEVYYREGFKDGLNSNLKQYNNFHYVSAYIHGQKHKMNNDEKA